VDLIILTKKETSPEYFYYTTGGNFIYKWSDGREK
jgi:hypothetical protein